MEEMYEKFILDRECLRKMKRTSITAPFINSGSIRGLTFLQVAKDLAFHNPGKRCLLLKVEFS
jgi:hypothetical protein